ncbi:MAG TPA: L-idonate 5-dehydrogenase [Arenibaculum sp.]|nr:L-idonate 5-dehydrogenase [Arenibaculum sp.]
MTNVVLHGARDLRLEELAPDDTPDDRVTVRFGAGGICGSDIHYYLHGRTGNFVVSEPLTLGHEIAGVVEHDRSGRLAGKRVAICPSVPCGRCPQCVAGQDNVCGAPFFMGSASRTPHMQGGFRSRLDVLPRQCHPLPDDVSLAAAALAEPLAVGVHAAGLAGDLAGRRALIMGAGPIGLLLLAVVRTAGAGHVAVADLSPAALARARSAGADDARLAARLATEPDPPGDYDVVFEASGSPAGFAAALDRVRRGGHVVQLGNLPGGDVAAPLSLVMSKGLRVSGSFRFTLAEYARAVELIVSKTVDPLTVVTGRFALEDAVPAFEASLDRERGAKILLVGAGEVDTGEGAGA